MPPVLLVAGAEGGAAAGAAGAVAISSKDGLRACYWKAGAGAVWVGAITGIIAG